MKVNLKMTWHMAKGFIHGAMASDQKVSSEKANPGMWWDMMNMGKYADCLLMGRCRKFIQVPTGVQTRVNIKKKKQKF